MLIRIRIIRVRSMLVDAETIGKSNVTILSLTAEITEGTVGTVLTLVAI